MTVEKSDLSIHWPEVDDTLERIEHDLATPQERMPLNRAAAAYVDELFGEGTSGMLALGEDDTTGIAEGLRTIHGGFEDPENTDIATTALGLMLQGVPQRDVPGLMGMSNRTVNRLHSEFRIKVHGRVLFNRDTAREVLQRKVLQYRPKQVLAHENDPPVMTETIEAEAVGEHAAGLVDAKPEAPERPKRNPAQKAAAQKAISVVERERLPEIDLFNVVLRNSHVLPDHFEVAAERMLGRASNEGVITPYQSFAILKDLTGKDQFQGISQNMLFEGKSHQAYLADLGRTYRGRLADDKQPNIKVMRSLFTLYARDQVSMSKLKKKAHGSVPEHLVPMLVGGAISEVLRTAASKKRSTR